MAWNGLTILETVADGPKLTRQIAAALDKPSSEMTGCLKALKRRGFISSAEGVHQITDAGREALAAGLEITSGPCNGSAVSRKANTLRAKAWHAMKIKDGFGLGELLSLVCEDSGGDVRGNMATYLLALEAAGYLASMRPDVQGNPRWRLKRDMAGPEAPAWNKKTRVLRDHNTGKAYSIPRKREVRHAA